jgi:hypothetical protein
MAIDISTLNYNSKHIRHNICQITLEIGDRLASNLICLEVSTNIIVDLDGNTSAKNKIIN